MKLIFKSLNLYKFNDMFYVFFEVWNFQGFSVEILGYSLFFIGFPKDLRELFDFFIDVHKLFEFSEKCSSNQKTKINHIKIINWQKCHSYVFIGFS